MVTTSKRLRDSTIATCACGCHVSACQHYWYDQKVKCNDCSYLWATRVHWCGRPGEIVAGRVLNAHWLVLAGGVGCVGVGGAGWEEGGGAAASSSVRVSSCGMSGLCAWVCLVVRVGLCRPPSSWADALQVCGACEDKKPVRMSRVFKACMVRVWRSLSLATALSLSLLLYIKPVSFSRASCSVHRCMREAGFLR